MVPVTNSASATGVVSLMEKLIQDLYREYNFSLAEHLDLSWFLLSSLFNKIKENGVVSQIRAMPTNIAYSNKKYYLI